MSSYGDFLRAMDEPNPWVEWDKSSKLAMDAAMEVIKRDNELDDVHDELNKLQKDHERLIKFTARMWLGDHLDEREWAFFNTQWNEYCPDYMQ